MGFLFILDALTGVPLHPVDEVEVPPSNVPGEVASRTQLIPQGRLGKLGPTSFSLDDLITESPFPAHNEQCRNLLLNETMLNLTSGKVFTPGGWQKAEMWVPGEIGGCNWGSLSIHPGKQWAIIPVNHLLTARGLVRKDQPRPAWCSSYINMDGAELGSCMMYVMGESQMSPCYKPPWARLVAVDLKTGEIVWEKPYGNNILDFNPSNITSSRKVFGGVMITASGLIVSSGTEDFNLWIHDIETGEALHHVELDYDTVSTPSTYMTGGEQYIVINSGRGIGIPSELSDGSEIVALKVPGATKPPPTTVTPMPTATPTPPVACGGQGLVVLPRLLTLFVILSAFCQRLLF